MVSIFPLLTMQDPLIEYPQSGDILQGVIEIKGSLNTQNYSSYEITFSYESDQTSTWFLITEVDDKKINRVLAVWDTSTITDGDYKIRIQVFTLSGVVRETIINNVYVRNYTPFVQPDNENTQVNEFPKQSNAQKTLEPQTLLQNENQQKNGSGTNKFILMIKYTIFIIIILFIVGSAYFAIRKKGSDKKINRRKINNI